MELSENVKILFMYIVIYAVSITCEFYFGTSYVAFYGHLEINKCKKLYTNLECKYFTNAFFVILCILSTLLLIYC